MNPSFDDRLSSVVRTMTDIILPALPPEANLARDLTQLTIAHLQIIRSQLDAMPEFEKEELLDAQALSAGLLAASAGGNETKAASAALRKALDPGEKHEHRQTRAAIHRAIDGLIRGCARDGSPAFREQLGKIVIEMQSVRAAKDRKWFAPMGFDTGAIE